jgi:hypothetical protein
VKVANVSQSDFDRYLATEPEPTLKGLLRFATPERTDIVYTGQGLARRIIDYLPIAHNHFCLDPCRGRGAFYDLLPEGRRDWCEVEEGRDFLTYDLGHRIDWVITNPPFSDAYSAIAARAFDIANNVAFLVKFAVATATSARHRSWRDAGHALREVVFVPWELAEFTAENGAEKAPEGFCLSLLIWSRGYNGDVRFTYWDDKSHELAEAADSYRMQPSVCETISPLQGRPGEAAAH